MSRIPTVKTILSHFTDLTKEQAKEIRLLMEEGSGYFINSRRVEKAMSRIDEVLGTHGVEFIAKGKNKKSPAFWYCNSGDPYSPTVLCVKDKGFRLGCYADLVEKGNYE